MKRLRVLKDILKDTHSDKILLGYLLFILADALIIFLVEPDINKYTDALWYCYEVISTTGFGEIVAATMVGRVASVLLTVYSLLIIAVVTGVVTNFYIQLTTARKNENLLNFLDRLEGLSELSRDELNDISAELKKYRRNKNLY